MVWICLWLLTVSFYCVNVAVAAAAAAVSAWLPWSGCVSYGLSFVHLEV